MMSVLPSRYNMDNLKDALHNPQMIIKELKRWPIRASNVVIQQLILKNLFRYRYGPGIDIMDQDWDNLIVLDACRYPEFEQHCKLEGDLRSVISKGSTSREWINKNFINREFHDTVYVGGNPHMEKFTNEFYHVRKSYSKSGVDEEYNMASGSISGWRPESVYEAASEAIGRFPNKRLIIHFMQPHDPYIGPKADELREAIGTEEDVSFKKRNEMDGTRIDRGEVLGSLRQAAQRGYISQEELFEAYNENLNIVLEYVEELLFELNGKTVVTSDHGELLGAGKFTSNKYGHPINVWQSELRIVPWLEINDSNRREIYSEDPIGVEEADEVVVEDNLEALGYK